MAREKLFVPYTLTTESSATERSCFIPSLIVFTQQRFVTSYFILCTFIYYFNGNFYVLFLRSFSQGTFLETP